MEMTVAIMMMPVRRIVSLSIMPIRNERTNRTAARAHRTVKRRSGRMTVQISSSVASARTKTPKGIHAARRTCFSRTMQGHRFIDRKSP